MNIFNPFQYTSRTFESLLQDINNNAELADTPNWYKNLECGIGDVASMWVDAVANNVLLPTAYTRKNVQMLLKLIDYEMTPHTTASGVLIFYINPDAVFPFTVAKSDLVAMTSGSSSVSSKRFESRVNVTVSAVTESFLPGAVTAGSDTITVVREFTTGEKIRLTTTSTLPAPLAIDTDYYVIKVNATTIKLATTLLNALAGTNIDLTDGGSGTHTIKLYSFKATCYQQQSKDSFSIGSSDGITKNQEFDLGDINILEDTLTVTINSIDWTVVDTFINSTSLSKNFRLFYNNDNSSIIQFGDGSYGAIPGNFDIYASYAIGGGNDSNVSVVNKINIYGGADSNVVGVMNPTAITGGANAQDMENARILGPMLLKARDRFVTVDDGKALGLAYGGISQINIISNAYGVLSAKVVAVAVGGGNPSPAYQALLQAYLIDRTILESIDCRVVNATITAVAVTAAAKVKPGYTWTGQVAEWFKMGWQLFLSECGKEIYDEYIENGVNSARELMNVIFSEAYSTTDNNQIIRFLDNLYSDNFSYRTFGENGDGQIQRSDYVSFLAAFTYGADYITVTTPAGDISIDEDEITTVGTLTLTEIP